MFILDTSDDDYKNLSVKMNYMRLRDQTFKEHFRMHKHTFEVPIIHCFSFFPITIITNI